MLTFIKKQYTINKKYFGSLRFIVHGNQGVEKIGNLLVMMKQEENTWIF